LAGTTRLDLAQLQVLSKTKQKEAHVTAACLPPTQNHMLSGVGKSSLNLCVAALFGYQQTVELAG
jgi:hypothetical protein